MANDDWIAARGGLLPVGYPLGGYKVNYYKLTTTATGDGIYIGQPMDLDGTGCTRATTGSDLQFILGPALGFLDAKKAGIPSAMTKLDQGSYLPANTDAWVAIADDPDQRFTIQADTSGTVAAADVGSTARFTLRSAAGNTTTGYSTAELLTSDIAADTGGSLKIIALHDNVNSDGTDNAADANYCKVVVKIHQHRLGNSFNNAI